MTITVAGLIKVCGAIITIGGAYAAIKKHIATPIKNMSNQLDAISDIKAGQKVMMKGLATTMEHLATGNHIEQVQSDYKELRDYLIERD